MPGPPHLHPGRPSLPSRVRQLYPGNLESRASRDDRDNVLAEDTEVTEGPGDGRSPSSHYGLADQRVAARTLAFAAAHAANPDALRASFGIRFGQRRRRTRQKTMIPSADAHPPALVGALPCVVQEQPDEPPSWLVGGGVDPPEPEASCPPLPFPPLPSPPLPLARPPVPCPPEPIGAAPVPVMPPLPEVAPPVPTPPEPPAPPDAPATEPPVPAE